MKDFLTAIFEDPILSYLTRKYGTKLNDSQRLAKCQETLSYLRDNANFSITSTQAIVDKKGLNEFESTNLNGQSVYRLTKKGLFGKPKLCYYITRTKDEVTIPYLDQIFDELRQQALGDNIFNAPDYKN